MRFSVGTGELPEPVRARLLHHLGVARSAVRTAKQTDDEAAVTAARARVGAAKRGLGERGTPWWDQDADARRERWTAALAELDPSSWRRPGAQFAESAGPESVGYCAGRAGGPQ